MKYSEKKYGRARIVGGVRVFHEFDNSVEAIEWHKCVTQGWRRVFVTEAMIYNDADCTDKMLAEFDMLALRFDTEDYGFHKAYEWAQVGKYGSNIPDILVKPIKDKNDD